MTTLRERLMASGRDLERRSLNDEHRQVSLADAAETGRDRTDYTQFRGMSVMLAIDSQLSTVLALLALDGIARRIVLSHPDTDDAQLRIVQDAAGTQMVIDCWPPHTASEITSEPNALPTETEWVLLTSGTTGKPKLVLHTLATLAGHLCSPAPGDTDRIWSTFYDVRRYGGLQILLRALVSGETLVLAGKSEHTGAFLRRAGKLGVTHLLGTPSHWRRALMSGEIGAIAPDYIRLSGEVADQAILDQLHRTCPHARIVHAFASTEAGLVIEVADGLAGLPAKLDMSGAFADIEVKGGTLHARSPRTGLGYLNGTTQPFAADDGYVDTGDVVRLEHGRWYFDGRLNGVINVGGQKVHPEEVEAVILQHPSVRMCSVHARANAITGALVEADIVCNQGIGQTTGDIAPSTSDIAADIAAFCRSRLPSFKVPARIRLREALDIAPSGKVVRRHA